MINFNIYIIQLILNIDCNKIIEEIDDREDEFTNNIQKTLIMRVIQKCFCEMLIGGRKTIYTDSFLKWPISGRICKIIHQGLWVTVWNSDKGTIYQPRNKVYQREGQNELIHC